MTRRPDVLIVIGTRPEAIKMTPVVLALRTAGVPVRVVASGQHGALADDALAGFGLRADFRLNAGGADGLAAMGARVTAGLAGVLAAARPGLLMVHGDTATALAAAIAGLWTQVPVAHVEAGLRTHDAAQPWPEESHRRAIASIANLHFAPTPLARSNLLAESVADGAIHVTGNTVVDALRLIETTTDWAALGSQADARWPALRKGPLVLATLHRRETVGAPLLALCDGLARLARDQDVTVLLPIHPNPAIGGPVRARLADTPGVILTEPLPYPLFLSLLGRAALAVTDSGGVQEEAPTSGTPVLVARAVTERPEAVDSGHATLIGHDPRRLAAEAARLLAGPRPPAASPFGDGRAAERIAAITARWLGATPATLR